MMVSAAMSHAVGVIRAEEDRLGVPHHIVSAQGTGYTSDISQYTTAPLPYDNVVYEVHGYPPSASSYWPAGADGGAPNIPIIIGEYGSLPANDAGTNPTFFDDLEAKKIPSLAWDFDSYNDCAPDLVNVDQSFHEHHADDVGLDGPGLPRVPRALAGCDSSLHAWA